MSVLSVKTIPTRNWKNRNIDVVTERDKGRKQSQQKVDERIHYLWFHYLKLALNLEQLNYNVEKRGGRGKFIHSKGSQYHSLVKRYNVFIEFLNRKTGDYDKDMQLCKDIMKKYQKERFDQIKRDDPRSREAKPFNERIHKDIKECEKTI